MNDPQNAALKTVVAGDANGASVDDDGVAQEISGQSNSDSLSPAGVAEGAAATDDTGPHATAATDDAPAEIPTYHVFLRDGVAVVPYDFPPTKEDRKGNPTLTLPGIGDLHRDFYAINLYTLGPLLDKEQRDNAGRIVTVPSRNTPTEENIDRCRVDLHRMLAELWKRMPSYFDTAMAEVAKADERLCDKSIRDKICTGKQVMSIISRLSFLTEEGRYGELMAICYRYFNLLSRETGRTSWVMRSVIECCRRFGYPIFLGPIPANKRKRGHKLCRIAKSWATRSILQAFRNGQVGWFGCRMFFRDPSAAMRAKMTDGHWRQWDIGDYIDPRDRAALKSSRGDKKGTLFWILHKRTVDPFVCLRARLKDATEAAYVEGISRSEWENAFQQSLAKSPYGALKRGTNEQNDEGGGNQDGTDQEEKQVVLPPGCPEENEATENPSDEGGMNQDGTDPEEKQVAPPPGCPKEKEATDNPSGKQVVPPTGFPEEKEATGPGNVLAPVIPVLPADNPSEKQVVPPPGGPEEKEATGPENVLAPVIPVMPALNLTPAVPQTLATPSVEQRANGTAPAPEDQPPAEEAKNVDPPNPGTAAEGRPRDRSKETPEQDSRQETPKAPPETKAVDPRKKKKTVEKASKKRSAGGSGLAERMKKAINQENENEEQEKAKAARKKREYAKRTGMKKDWKRGMKNKFGAYGCCNCFAEKVNCVHVMCRFCGEDIKKELEIKEGEKEEDHQVRTSVIETEWLWKELESCDERRCNHRFSNLKYWEDQKEVGRKRPNCPLVARYCIECGDEL